MTAIRVTAGRLAPIHWHRPLLLLAILMAVGSLGAVVGILVDPREVTGNNVWLKPLKFSLSIVLYAVTLSWLIGQLRRYQRVARIAGTVSTVFLLVEMVIIVGAAAAGDTSHFNVSTPLHVTLWSIMALSIIVVWLMTLLVAAILFATQWGDAARALAVRSGAILALVGMAVAFFMVTPTDAQLADYRGIAGAHTVGLADGGPGLPLVGWSTVAGDLRVPHFVGMHALQLLPILVILLEFLATRGSSRWRLLSSDVVRLRLVTVAVVAYAAAIVLLTWQALSAQSVVQPAGPILVAGIVLVAATAGAVVTVLVLARNQQPAAIGV
ncbi:MAG: hypothetical protein JWQ43_472 [Glaciihabitans sp.]|nr:hypothetical protein [Glaciihabitans sp.]